MYLFMTLPSRKGFQSDCNNHICSMFVNVSVYGSPIKKGLQSDCNDHLCSMSVNVSVYGSPIKKGFPV